MKKFFILVCFLIFAINVSIASAGTKEDMKKDIVQIIDGKMTAQEFGLYHININGYEPEKFQVKFYAEAANTGFISRDYFVAIYTYLQTNFLQMKRAMILGILQMIVLECIYEK